MNSTVLIIGASRGLGLGLVAEYLERGAEVVATVRGPRRTPLHDLLDDSDGRLEIEHVDITSDDEVAALGARLAGRTFDLLFVNAGVTHELGLTAGDIPVDEFVRVMVTNALAPMRLVERLDGLVDHRGTIAVMSSGQGSVARNTGGGWEIYRASKAALDQLMRSYAGRHADGTRTLLLMAPGWVQTELGGSGAPFTVAQSARGLATTMDAQRGRPDLQFLDHQGEVVPW